MEKIIRKANLDDIVSVVNIYESLKGSEGCVWNEHYPTLDDAKSDINSGALYVIATLDDNIVGCITLTVDEEQDRLNCWSDRMKKPCEITRLGIIESYQHKGYAKKLVAFAEKEAESIGYDGICLLACKYNPSALSLYYRMNYTPVGEIRMYDNDYICFEKVFK